MENATEQLSEYLERDITQENLLGIKQKVQDKYRYVLLFFNFYLFNNVMFKMPSVSNIKFYFTYKCSTFFTILFLMNVYKINFYTYDI